MQPSDDDDSPAITDPYLLDQQSPYQTVITAIRNDQLPNIENHILHQALRDVVLSSDDLAHEALSYICEAGAPTQPLPSNDPLATIAACRPMHPNYLKLLTTLARYGFDFGQPNHENKTASMIVHEKSPEFMSIVNKQANSAEQLW
jgi:hypothetical protein